MPFWPNLVFRAHFDGVCPSLANSSEEGPRHNFALMPRPLKPPCMVFKWDKKEFRGLSPTGVEITQSSAPSTKWLYALKWHLFINWCSSREEDPWRFGIGSVLSFLQEGLERHITSSTFKVNVVAIAANHDTVDGRSMGKHNLSIRFLRGAQRLNSPRLYLIPSWDLSVVFQVLQRDPFEPLESVKLSALSMKTTLLTAFTSVKRLGIYRPSLWMRHAYSYVVLRPRPGYVPKILTTPSRIRW